MSLIEVDHVSKDYRLGQTHNLLHGVKRALTIVGLGNEPPRPRFKALEDVHFKVEAGEVLGVIGTNGAGKSTLLKVLAGITTPTTGHVHVRGRTAPLIEVGAGLVGDLTGRENIFLNGVILGMSFKEIRRKIDEIIDFAELEKFIDTPIKRYSSGMAVRLGFAIATAVDTDILIVDEVLAVGDIAFQRKCFDRMEDIIRKQGKTILLVSHNIRQVERLCTRAILLDHGHIVADGKPQAVCGEFFDRTNAKVRAATMNARAGATTPVGRDPFEGVKLAHIALCDTAGNPLKVVPFGSDVLVKIRLETTRELVAPVFGFGVHTSDLLYLADHESPGEIRIESLPVGTHEFTCHVRRLPLVPGVYGLRFGISEKIDSKIAFYGENLLHFQVATKEDADITHATSAGFFMLDGKWLAPRLVDARPGDAPRAAERVFDAA